MRYLTESLGQCRLLYLTLPVAQVSFCSVRCDIHLRNLRKEERKGRCDISPTYHHITDTTAGILWYLQLSVTRLWSARWFLVCRKGVSDAQDRSDTHSDFRGSGPRAPCSYPPVDEDTSKVVYHIQQAVHGSCARPSTQFTSSRCSDSKQS